MQRPNDPVFRASEGFLRQTLKSQWIYFLIRSNQTSREEKLLSLKKQLYLWSDGVFGRRENLHLLSVLYHAVDGKRLSKDCTNI